MNQKFTRARRITSKMEYDRVFLSGKRIAYHGINAWLVTAPHPRLGCAISRRIGNNVQRNKFKRRVRAAFRTCYQQLPANDIVITTSNSIDRYKYRDIEALFRIICDKRNHQEKNDG